MSADEAELVSSEEEDERTKSAASDVDEKQAFKSSSEENDSLAGEKNSSDAKAKKKSDKSKDEGELEDGEITDSDGDDQLLTSKFQSEHPRIVALPDENPRSIVSEGDNTGVCKFFQRGSCTWGENCKYKHVWDQNWQLQQRNNRFVNNTNNRHSVFVTNVQPIPLASLNTLLPQSEWDRAILKRKKDDSSKKQSETPTISDHDSQKHEPSKQKHRSSSSSSRELELQQKRIPSLLDLSPTAPARYPKRDVGPQVSYGRNYRQTRTVNVSKSPESSSHRKHNSGSTTSSTRYVVTALNRELPGFKQSSSRHWHEDAERHNHKIYRDKNQSRHASSKSECRRRSPSRSRNKDSNRRRYDNRERDEKTRKRSSRSSSTSPIGFRTKNPTRQQIEEYFAERDDEKPAAYRMDINSSPDIKKGSKNCHRSSSSSSSSSSISSSESSSSSSDSSASSTEIKRRKNVKTSKVEAISDDSDLDEANGKLSEPQQISSDEAHDDKAKKSNLEPQQISSSDDEDSNKKMSKQITLGDEEIKIEKKQLKNKSPPKKRKRLAATFDNDNSDLEDDRQHRKHKGRRIKLSESPASFVDNFHVETPPPPPPEDQRAHDEDAVLGMDIGEVLEQYESRAATAQSPVNVA